MDRVLDLLHKVKYEQDGSLTFRRSCAHGVCGSDAMLINGRNRLACKIRVDQLGKRRITVAPLPGPARDQGPRRRHGGVLREVPQRPAVPDQDERPAADARAAPVAGGARPLRRHHQVHPVRRLHGVVPVVLGAARRTSGRRRSCNAHRFIFDSATRAPTSGSRSWPTRTASGAAGRSSTAPTPARAGSTSPRRSSRSRRRSWSVRPERPDGAGGARPPGLPAPDHPDRRRGPRQSRARRPRVRSSSTGRGADALRPDWPGPTRRSPSASASRRTTSPSTTGVVRALELAQRARGGRRSTCSSTRS